MDKYCKWQLKSMGNRFLREKDGKRFHKRSEKVKTWDELYNKMRKDLEGLKEQNKLQDERIRVMSILEHAEQRKENIGLDKALPLVSLIIGTAAGLASAGFSNKVIELLQETFAELSMLLESLICYTIIPLILAGALIVIVSVYCVGWLFCKIKQNDIVYCKTKLNIIDMLLAEDTEKRYEAN